MNRFFRTLLVSIRKRCMRLFYEEFCIRKVDGALWAIKPHDKRFSYYFKYCAGWYNAEQEHMNFMQGICKKIKPSMFIDVGANYGYYTVRLMRYFPHIHCAMAFEPANDALQYLGINTFINDLQDRVQISPIAISNQSGETELLIDPWGASTNTLPNTEMAKESRYSSEHAQHVKMDTLDNVVDKNNQTLLIKIDVEGHELEVLQGAKKLLQNNACVVQIETFNNNRQTVEQIFKEVGYQYLDEIGDDRRADIWWASPSLSEKISPR